MSTINVEHIVRVEFHPRNKTAKFVYLSEDNREGFVNFDKHIKYKLCGLSSNFLSKKEIELENPHMIVEGETVYRKTHVEVEISTGTKIQIYFEEIEAAMLYKSHLEFLCNNSNLMSSKFIDVENVEETYIEIDNVIAIKNEH